MIVTDKNKVKAAEEFLSRNRGARPEKPRTVQEISARYEQARQQYQILMHAQVDNREQRVMLYSELKALGWCLGRSEQRIVREINSPVQV